MTLSELQVRQPCSGVIGKLILRQRSKKYRAEKILLVVLHITFEGRLFNLGCGIDDILEIGVWLMSV